MEINSGDVIKHVKFLDVALLVMKVTEVPEGLKVRAHWINQGRNTTFFLPAPTHELIITEESCAHWFKSANTKVKCIRNEPWKPIRSKKNE